MTFASVLVSYLFVPSTELNYYLSIELAFIEFLSHIYDYSEHTINIVMGVIFIFFI
jgi:hypothetical protein